MEMFPLDEYRLKEVSFINKNEPLIPSAPRPACTGAGFLRGFNGLPPFVPEKIDEKRGDSDLDHLARQKVLGHDARCSRRKKLPMTCRSLSADCRKVVSRARVLVGGGRMP